MKPFENLEMIDNIVTGSKGAYTHNKVFMMSLDFCYDLTLMKYEQSMFNSRYAAIEKEINKPPTKK